MGSFAFCLTFLLAFVGFCSLQDLKKPTNVFGSPWAPRLQRWSLDIQGSGTLNWLGAILEPAERNGR